MNQLERLSTGLDLRKVPIKGRVKAIADKTGYSAGMVSKVLSGKVDNIERFVKVVCNEYMLDENYVWGLGDGNPLLPSISWDDQPEKEYFPISAVANEALNEIMKMSDTMQWRAVAMLKEMNDKNKSEMPQ